MRTRSRLQNEILDYFDENPHASTREAAPYFDCSHMHVWRTLRGDKKHPFHLKVDSKRLRTTFAVQPLVIRKLATEHNLANESTFTRVGMYSQHNTHLWMHENPHACRVESFQYRFSVNVWAGIIGTHILEPVFLPRLTGDAYLLLLRETLPTLLEDVLFIHLQEVFYQHDARRCPCPLEVFGSTLMKSIESAGSVAAAQSSGPSDQEDEDLRNRILNAFQIVRNDTEGLSKLKHQLRKRALKCIEQGVGHFERACV